MKNDNKGLILGLSGVTLFALTLPATRYVINDLDPVFIGLGRACVAAVFAMLILVISRSPLPDKRQFIQLLLVACGVVVIFPVLSAYAMQSVDASHGGIMLALLPLATAFFSIFIAHEKPSRGFWIAAFCGSLLVFCFALIKGKGSFKTGDIALVGAIAGAAFSYAVGGKLSREMHGWQVICWALIIALPVIIVPTFMVAPVKPLELPLSVWAGFLYLALFSQLIGFFVWNKGLATGGIARVSQTQLLQPFITLVASAMLLGESIDLASMLFCILVVITVAIGKRMPVYH